MFRIGDMVAHPMHGAGIIDNIVTERIAGAEQDYYVFRMPVGGLVLKIPTASSGLVGLRNILDPVRAARLLSDMAALEVDRFTGSWNQRYRENMLRLKSGNLLEVARVVKGLMIRDGQRGLSNGERKMLHSAKQILISEIVLSQNTTYEDVEARINTALA